MGHTEAAIVTVNERVRRSPLLKSRVRVFFKYNIGVKHLYEALLFHFLIKHLVPLCGSLLKSFACSFMSDE